MKYKARDLTQLYREHTPERASLMVLVEIIEHITAMNEQMNELTRTVDKIIDMMGGMAGGYKGLKDEVQRIRGKLGNEEE